MAEIPSLGPALIDWTECFFTTPDCADDVAFVPTNEQCTFLAKFYRVHPVTGARLIRRGVYSRPKGAGKSPLLGCVSGLEGLAPVLFDHWAKRGERSYWGYRYKIGEPVGKPWREVCTPLVQLSAVSEDQTRNAWTPLLEMMSNPRVLEAFPGLEPMQTFVNLPGGGRIEFVTSSAHSREGNRPIFAAIDQSETWLPSNGGVRLAATMRRNLGKTGGSSIESPNAYLPGEGSVAESSAAYWQTIEGGKAKDDGLLYDHREAPADTDLSDRDSLLEGLRIAYGDSAKDNGGWVDLQRLYREIMDPDTDPQDARRFYLNQITHATDAYVSHTEWAACLDAEAKLVPGDIITLGFDGSRGRARGKPDATGLVATRVADGFQHPLGGWEADEGPGMESWEPPLPEIDAAWDEAFRVYRVAAAYADPAKDWRSKVNEWEAKYARKLLPNSKGFQVKAGANHPFEWWMVGGRSVFIERAVLAYEAAIRNGEMSHAGDYQFTAHVLNARRRLSHQKLTIGKSSDSSYKKVDLAVCAVLSWQARLDCITAGIGTTPARSALRRIR